MSSYTLTQDWARRLRNPFAGLHWFSRCSDDAPMIVARHYPHLLCWSWSITWRPHGPLWVHFMRHNCGGNAWIGSLCFDWQNYRIRRTESETPK
jgi:hypothetical protein